MTWCFSCSQTTAVAPGNIIFAILVEKYLISHFLVSFKSVKMPSPSAIPDIKKNLLVLTSTIWPSSTTSSEICSQICLVVFMLYINNCLHLARKYARIFVRGHYLFREADRFPRAKLEENCELQGTNNVQGQISEHIFAAKLRLLCLFSIGFKNWGISSDIPQF